MTKKRFHTSLQLKLTLLLSLLMIVSCVLMYFFISHSAVSGMDGLQNYMIKVDPQDGDSPITFNVDPKALFPQFEQEIQETKEDFLLRSVIATTIIILLSSVCTYFLTKKTLTPLQKLTSEVSQIQAQNLSTQLAVPNSKDEIAQLTSSFNEMLARLDNAFSTQKQFSANAAHELRTPLAVLQTNLEVFEKKQEPEMVEYQQLFTMIKEQTARLSQLVGTLLDMTNLKSVPRTDHATWIQLQKKQGFQFILMTTPVRIGILMSTRLMHLHLITIFAISPAAMYFFIVQSTILWKMPLNTTVPMALSQFR